MLFLQSHGVSTAHATKIWKTYGDESLKVVQENPYRLADDIWGIGFKTADTIAEKLGFEKEKFVRLRSGLLYTLNKLSEEGHCYALRDQLMKTGSELLSVEEALLSMTLDEMIRAEDVKVEHTDEGIAIYLPPFYFSEVGTARRIKEIFDAPRTVEVDPNGLEERITRMTGMTYDLVQMDAIKTAAKSKILVLTGGPGTGKTTTTLGIITAFQAAGASILLAAPTGRAAKRLSEATGLEAKTIHRLLEVKPPEGYQRNETNPLEGDVLIVDECSMIDIMLMYALLRAMPDSMTLILVGDVDQLPSVGAGNMLRDIIESDAFPVVRLTKIFRQAATSRIITNAHVEFCLLKRRRNLVLHNFSACAVAHHLTVNFERLNTAHIDANARVVFESKTAGGSFRIAIGVAYLLAELVDENDGAVISGNSAGKPAHSLRHQPSEH